MGLSEDCAEKLCGIAVAAGVLGSGALGVTVASGVLELLTGGGQLALAVSREQRARWDGYLKTVKKQIVSGYGQWLKAECGDDWSRRADVEAALEALNREIASVRPTATDIALAGHKPADLVTLLMHRLPADSAFRASDTASRVFSAMIIGTFELIRTDSASLAALSSFSFERIFDELALIRGQLTHAERVQQEMLESQKRIEARTLDRLGIHPKHLVRLFAAVGQDGDIPPERYEAELESAIDALIARSADPVRALNDSEAVVQAIRDARRMLRSLDAAGALARLERQEDEERAAIESRRHGTVRLMAERADILRELFRHDEAIALYDEASALDPDNLYCLRRAGATRRANRPLQEARDAFERFRDAAKRLGDDREVSVAYNEIGDLLAAEGRREEALARHRDGLAIAERLAAADPGNTAWQRDLSISFDRIGDLLAAEGRREEALARYRDGLAIRERLAAADPGNTAWQRDLSISFDRIGDLLAAEGRREEALARHRDGLAIRERLAAADPGNTAWQRDLSVSFNKIGDLLAAEGRREEALARYRDGLAIRERLAAADPGNTAWQRDLSISFERIGDLLAAEGRREEALARHRDGLAIAERLAAADPGNTEWQRDLSISFDRIGNLLAAEGRREEALARYRDGLAIRERLAAADPGNTEWQRDLSISFDRIGDLLAAEGRREEALARYRDGLAIRERLAAADPGNTAWQRDLSVSFDKIGDLLAAEGRREEALARHRDSLAIRERLAAADPGNTEWQRDLSISFDRIGDLLAAEGRREEALARHRDGLAIAERLAAADPGNTEWQRDLSISFEKIGNLLAAEGRREEALARYRDGLAIRERLAAADPGNTAWQRDLIVSRVKLSETDPDNAGEHLRRALEIATALAASGRLAPVDSWIPDHIRRRIADLG